MKHDEPVWVSRRPMGPMWHLFHWTMIVSTCGLWYPFYRSRLRARTVITKRR